MVGGHYRIVNGERLTTLASLSTRYLYIYFIEKMVIEAPCVALSLETEPRCDGRKNKLREILYF